MIIKYDEIIKTLEQKQNRTPKEESGLRELKKLEESKKEIEEKIERENLRPANLSDKMSGEYFKLVSQQAAYDRKERNILMGLGLLKQKRIHRPTITPLTEEEQEELRKRKEEETKRGIEEAKRKMLEQEFQEWKRKKESGELEFEEYRMRKQFMQTIVQQQEEILLAIRSGLANMQGVIKDNAEQTARAEEWYRARRENYRIQDEMMKDFFQK